MKKDKLSVEFKMSEFEPVIKLTKLLQEILEDDRIEPLIRQEYIDKANTIIW